MTRADHLIALGVLIASLSILQPSALGQTSAGPDQYRAMLTTYCVTCHNTRAKTGGLAFDGLDLAGRGG